MLEITSHSLMTSIVLLLVMQGGTQETDEVLGARKVSPRPEKFNFYSLESTQLPFVLLSLDSQFNLINLQYSVT
jgi:hypothetical protein